MNEGDESICVIKIKQINKQKGTLRMKEINNMPNNHMVRGDIQSREEIVKNRIDNFVNQMIERMR
jgi:hypothetical protein